MLNLNNKSNKVRLISDGGGYITHKNVKYFTLIGLIYFVISTIFFGNIVNVKGISGSSGSGDTTATGEGDWYYDGYTGLKITITNENGKGLGTKIFLNDNSFPPGTKFSTNNDSKNNQSSSISWTQYSRNNSIFDSGVLDINFFSDRTTTTKLDYYLENSNYNQLKSLIKKISYDESKAKYIIVEPMAVFPGKTGENYYGTLYELANYFLVGSSIDTNKTSSTSLTRDTFFMFRSLGNVLYAKTKDQNIFNICSNQLNSASSSSTWLANFQNKKCCYGVGIYEYETIFTSTPSTPTDPDDPEDEKPTCESEFEKIDIYDMDERIELYEEWGHKGLLDMSNTTAEDACGPSSCGKKASTSCLSGSYENKYFDDDDISCFNATYSTSNGGTAFCLESFTLRNNLSSSTFYTNSGRLPIQYLAKTIAATGTLTRKCYIYGGGALSKPKYSNYVSEVKLDNRVLDYDLNENTSGSWWSVYTGTAKYYLNPIYAETGTGEVSYSALNNYYKFMGYGVISQFNYKNQYNIQFSLRLGSSFPLSTKSYSSTACKVIPTQEVIITDDNPKKPDKLRLEFRIIDTSNPFPGKSGTVRIVGTNWRATSNLLTSNSSYSNWLNNNWKKSSSYINHSYAERADNRGFNSYASYIMETTNNSYNKNKTGPKYKFLLTPTEIKNIRDYNKKNKYDDFTLTCEKDATNCKSTKFFNEVGLKNLVNN